MSTPLPPPPFGATVLDATGRMEDLWREWSLAYSNAASAASAIPNAPFITFTVNSALTNPRNLGLLSSGYLKITVALGSAVPSSTATIPTIDLSGTLQAAQFPALTTDVTTGAGSLATSIIKVTGKITSYNGVATAGWGVPAIQGTGRAAAQIAAVTSVATYTVGAADGSFLISANVLVTTSTLHNFTVTCAYTDESNVARTLTLSFSQLTGAFITAITNATGAGPYEGVPLHLRCKAATAITIATTGTFTTVVYNVDGLIQQVS